MSTGYSEEIFPHEEEYEDYDNSMATFFLKINIQSNICKQEFSLMGTHILEKYLKV